MKKLFLLFLGLIITAPIDAQTKAEIFAKENTEKLSEILGLTETENVQVYYILVEKETEFNLLRNKYKDDKDTLRGEIQKLNPIYNSTVISSTPKAPTLNVLSLAKSCLLSTSAVV